MKTPPIQLNSASRKRLLPSPIISAMALVPLAITPSMAGTVLIPAIGNSATGSNAYVVGGDHNEAQGPTSFVLGGSFNKVQATSTLGSVFGGKLNSVSANFGTVMTGQRNVSSGTGSIVVGGIDNSVTGLDSVILSGTSNTASGTGSAVFAGSDNSSSASRGVIINGVSNTIGAQGTNSSIAGGQNNLIAPAGNSTGSFIGGGSGNQVSATYCSIVAGTSNLASANSAFVGGGSGNSSTGTYAATGAGQNNTASASWAFIGGGFNSVASNGYSTVSGGFMNTAGGNASTVGGGRGNTASAAGSTVSGGQGNTASGNQSTVVGGIDNTASGWLSTILGGKENTASGTHSTAGGQNAIASGINSFVWGKNITTSGTGSVTLADQDTGNRRNLFPVNVSATNRFTGIFKGGYVLYTHNSPGETPVGVTLAPNGTAWQVLSDRESKTDFKTVDTVAVLEKVAAMPMTSWKYKHDSDTRYMGVMAQDLYDAFELGEGDKTINTLVADGVQIAAIQGLNQKLEQKVQEIDGLKKKQAALEAKMERLEKLLSEH
ncbi:MAG: tail fiber domain-containing protein [Luteolibacter sp.]